jgi:hypothetical protein
MISFKQLLIFWLAIAAAQAKKKELLKDNHSKCVLWVRFQIPGRLRRPRSKYLTSLLPFFE